MTYADIIDIRGLSLTAPSAAAVERFDALIDDIYYYRLGTGDRLDALLQEFPDFVLAYVLKGYSLMTEYTLDAHPKARAHLLKAEALPANPRERLHQEALRGWIAQDFSARAAAWEQILVEWPLDLLALRQHTGTLFWTGDKRHQAEVSAAVAGHWGPRTPGYGHFLSAHAFAMEEVGQYEVAERCAREAWLCSRRIFGPCMAWSMCSRCKAGSRRVSNCSAMRRGFSTTTISFAATCGGI
jgi:hypothetical protein